MLDEARKREKLANMALLATLGLTAAQSPKDFLRTGHIEGPGSALMQRFAQKRREAERNLDHGAVSQAARNIKDSGARNRKVKPSKKSLKEFIELSEMRKEDKVKGKGRTNLIKTITKKRVERDSEDGRLKVRRYDRQVLDSPAHVGRFKQGMKDPTQLPGAVGIDMPGTARHPHGGGGSGAKDGKPGVLRGKKKVPGEKKERNRFTDGPSPAEKVANRRAYKKQQDKMYRSGRRQFEGFSNWRDDYSPLEIESFDLITNKPLEPTEGIGSDMLDEKCWKGYEKKGMKKMFGKMYPNCVKKTRKEEVEIDEGKYSAPGEMYVKGSAPVTATYGGKTEKFYKETYKKKAKKKVEEEVEIVDEGIITGMETSRKIRKDFRDRKIAERQAKFQTRIKKPVTGEVALGEGVKGEKSPEFNKRRGGAIARAMASKGLSAEPTGETRDGGRPNTRYKPKAKLDEEKKAKSCPAGKYWCYDSSKCKKIPMGYYVGRSGYLEKEEETKKNGGNGNGNGNGNGGNGNGGDSSGSNGGGDGGGGE